jgi:hypothetical protein
MLAKEMPRCRGLNGAAVRFVTWRDRFNIADTTADEPHSPSNQSVPPLRLPFIPARSARLFLGNAGEGYLTPRAEASCCSVRKNTYDRHNGKPLLGRARSIANRGTDPA